MSALTKEQIIIFFLSLLSVGSQLPLRHTSGDVYIAINTIITILLDNSSYFAAHLHEHIWWRQGPKERFFFFGGGGGDRHDRWSQGDKAWLPQYRFFKYLMLFDIGAKDERVDHKDLDSHEKKENIFFLVTRSLFCRDDWKTRIA